MAIVVAGVHAQAPPEPPPAPIVRDASRPASRRDPALETLAGDAANLPPELAADALIRIASSARVAESAWKRELLTDAFIDAYGARDQYRRSTPQVIPPDTRQGAQLMASAMSLNRLSLQVRAAQLMAFIDPRRARELFEWIDLDLAPGVCEDLLVPSVDEYYSALSLLARTTFGNDRGEALRFLELYLWRARLPSEMPAVARALLRFNPTPAETPYFETLFTSILETGARDARGFSASASDIVSRTADFQTFEQKAGFRGIHLLESLRDYLVGQMRGPRCADSITESMTPAAFDRVVIRADLFYDVRLIDQAIAPSNWLAPARIDQFWQTGEAAGLHARLFQLRGTGREPVARTIRETAEWQNDAEQLLVAVDQWTGQSEPVERDYLAQKSRLYLGLLDLIPRGPLRVRTIRSFVDYLRHADENAQDRALWFAFVNHLLELSRGDDRGEVLEAFDAAHHPVLAVYAQLERLAPVGQR
jgi:hypothetical protein